MEIGVARVDAADAVLAHQHGDVQVVHEVAADIRQLGQGLFEYRRMPGGGLVILRNS